MQQYNATPLSYMAMILVILAVRVARAVTTLATVHTLRSVAATISTTRPLPQQAARKGPTTKPLCQWQEQADCVETGFGNAQGIASVQGSSSSPATLRPLCLPRFPFSLARSRVYDLQGPCLVSFRRGSSARRCRPLDFEANDEGGERFFSSSISRILTGPKGAWS